MIQIYEKNEVRKEIVHVDFDQSEIDLCRAVDALKDFAENSIHADKSENASPEDNERFVNEHKAFLKRRVQNHINELKGALEELEAIEPKP